MDKINNIGLSRLLTSVYDFEGFTEQEVWCRIAQKINIIIEHFNYLDKKIENEKENNKAKFDYLLGEGLTETVAKIILEKISDGTIGELINETLLKDINDKVDEEIGKVNEQLDTIETNFKSTIEQENVKLGNELLTSSGWTSSGWTGDFNNGFTHIVGQTLPLKYSLTNIQGKMLKIELTLTNVSGGSNSIASYNDFTLSIGGTPTFEVYEGSFDEHTFSYGLIALTNDDLIITPRAEWDGKITNISVREIIGGLDSTLQIKDSNDEVSFEITNTLKELNNVFIGQDVGKKNIRGNKNVGIGGNALKNNTTGFWNTAIGIGALEENLIGTRNVAIGLYAMRENLYADRNVAVGSYALHRNISGRNNIALGADTLWNNTTGNNNIGLSNCALDHNTTGSGNIGMGYYSLYHNTTGNGNIALGHMTLNYGENIQNNIALGEQALYKTLSNYNIGIGKQAMMNNSGGYENIALGLSALRENIDGVGNVAIGSNACGTNGTGSVSRNVTIGINAGTKLSNNAQKNIMIGGSCGGNTTTGSNNILIGDSINAPSAESSNHLNIGNLLYGDMSVWRLGIRVQSPTAFLHVRQGNTETPPLKIDKGSLTTSPQVGAIEFNGDRLFITLQNGERKELAFRGE